MPPLTDNRIAVHLQPAAIKAVKQGHPWVYDNSIRKQNKDAKAGALAVLFDSGAPAAAQLSDHAVRLARFRSTPVGALPPMALPMPARPHALIVACVLLAEWAVHDASPAIIAALRRAWARSHALPNQHLHTEPSPFAIPGDLAPPELLMPRAQEAWETPPHAPVPPADPRVLPPPVLPDAFEPAPPPAPLPPAR